MMDVDFQAVKIYTESLTGSQNVRFGPSFYYNFVLTYAVDALFRRLSLLPYL